MMDRKIFDPLIRKYPDFPVDTVVEAVSVYQSIAKSAKRRPPDSEGAEALRKMGRQATKLINQINKTPLPADEALYVAKAKHGMDEGLLETRDRLRQFADLVAIAERYVPARTGRPASPREVLVIRVSKAFEAAGIEVGTTPTGPMVETVSLVLEALGERVAQPRNVVSNALEKRL